MTDQPFPCFMCKSAGTCDRCRRLRAIGQLTLAATYMLSAQIGEILDPNSPHPVDVANSDAIFGVWETYHRNLDAIAHLMIDRGRLVRAHRKELNEEIRDAQRGARDAYAEGREDAQRGDW